MAEVIDDDEFDYVGIDRSLAMRTMCQRIWKAAVRGTLIGPQAKAAFLPTWDSFPMDFIGKDTCALLVFSYFFASHFLSPDVLASLAQFVNNLRSRQDVAAVLMFYLNSTADVANAKYQDFGRLLGVPVGKCCTETIEFQTKIAGPTKKETFFQETIELK